MSRATRLTATRRAHLAAEPGFTPQQPAPRYTAPVDDETFKAMSTEARWRHARQFDQSKFKEPDR